MRPRKSASADPTNPACVELGAVVVVVAGAVVVVVGAGARVVDGAMSFDGAGSDDSVVVLGPIVVVVASANSSTAFSPKTLGVVVEVRGSVVSGVLDSSVAASDAARSSGAVCRGPTAPDMTPPVDWVDSGGMRVPSANSGGSGPGSRPTTTVSTAARVRRTVSANSGTRDIEKEEVWGSGDQKDHSEASRTDSIGSHRVFANSIGGRDVVWTRQARQVMLDGAAASSSQLSPPSSETQTLSPRAAYMAPSNSTRQ